MLITLKILLRTLLLPPGGLLIVAAAGAWLLRTSTTERSRKLGWALLAASLASFWLLATPLVAEALTRLATRYGPLELVQAANAQAVVILGGGEARTTAPEYGGEPAAGAGLLERIAYGAYVAHQTGLPVLVSATPEEASAMQRTLERDFAIEPRWVEARSRDTFQNAEFSGRLLKPAGVSRIVLVTDAVHEWRAAHEFESAGFVVTPAPVGIVAPGSPGLFYYVPNPRALVRSTQALYELAGDIVRQLLIALHLRRHST